MKPVRIQRKRTKGYKMPANTIYVGRPTHWGNPFVVGKDGDAAECVKKYRALIFMMAFDQAPMEPYLVNRKPLSVSPGSVNVVTDAPSILTLRGKNLACFCKAGEPCHADVLLEFANA